MTLRKRAPRVKQRWSALVFLVGFGLLVASVSSALATPSSDAGFEGADGNLAPNTTTPNFDWNSFATTSWGGTFPYRTSTKSVSDWEFRGFEDAENSGADTAFAGGTKQDDNCATVKYGPKPPNKDDLERIYVAWTTGSNDHTYLALGWVRIPQNTTNASAHVAFEFNQDAGGCPNATIPGNNGLSFRSTGNGGDMLIVYDFEGSSTDNPTLKLLRWQNSGTCEATGKSAETTGPCWVFALNLTGAGLAEAKVNTSDVGSATDAIGPSAEVLGNNEFGEAIIDLTDAGVFPANPTRCLGFGRAFGVSRSSGNSAQAQMKDLVGPGDISISNCGRIVVEKVDDVGGRVDGAEFTVTPGQTSSGITASSSVMEEVETGLFCLDSLLIGVEYDVSETVVPDGYTGADDQTFTVEGSGDCDDVVSSTEPDLTFVNDRDRGSILVLKVDGDGDELAGAEFEATPVDEDEVPTGDAMDIPLVDGFDGAFCLDELLLGDYNVNESVVPDGYSGADDVIVTVDEASTCEERLDGEPSFDDLKGDADVIAENERLPGAIRIYKDAKDASAEETDFLSPLAGVTFTISGGDLADDIVTEATGDDGYTCVDGLTVGETYTITEEDVPAGYYLNILLTEDVEITTDATCDDETFAGDEASFTNDPLAEIEIIFRSLAGEGIMTATVECTNTDDLEPADLAHDTGRIYTDLLEGTYVCTIVIDP